MFLIIYLFVYYLQDDIGRYHSGIPISQLISSTGQVYDPYTQALGTLRNGHDFVPGIKICANMQAIDKYFIILYFNYFSPEKAQEQRAWHCQTLHLLMRQDKTCFFFLLLDFKPVIKVSVI